jgi:hypothetical protein
MARYTIIRDDNAVYVDGLAKTVDCSGMDGRVRAVQFDTVKGKGHVEYDNSDDDLPVFQNTVIDHADFNLMFGEYVTAWLNLDELAAQPDIP